MTLPPDELSRICENLRRQARIWLDGQAYDQLERLFAHIESLEQRIESLEDEICGASE